MLSPDSLAVTYFISTKCHEPFHRCSTTFGPRMQRNIGQIGPYLPLREQHAPSSWPMLIYASLSARSPLRQSLFPVFTRAAFLMPSPPTPTSRRHLYRPPSPRSRFPAFKYAEWPPRSARPPISRHERAGCRQPPPRGPHTTTYGMISPRFYCNDGRRPQR